MEAKILVSPFFKALTRFAKIFLIFFGGVTVDELLFFS